MKCFSDQEDIQESVIKILQDNMGLAAGENLLVMTDLPRLEDLRDKSVEHLQGMLERIMLARFIVEIASDQFSENPVTFYPFLATGGDGVELDKTVAERMLGYDVILGLTTYSLSHTDARVNACKQGARLASMPLFESRMLKPDGPLDVDSNQISLEAYHFAEYLTEAQQVIVRTPDGTDLKFSLEGRPGQVDDGIFANASGKWGNLPAGEAYAVPVEGSGQGVLVVSAGWYPKLDEEMIFEVKDGYAIDLRGGGVVGDHLRQLLKFDDDRPIYKARRNLAELGIGCNPNARKPDNILEAEKIKGTIHIAFGDNLHMGGLVESDSHEDFVLPVVDLILDGKTVISNGVWEI